MSGRGRLRFIPQDTASDCGLACLATVLDYYGWRGGLDALRMRFEVGGRGLTLADMLRIASAMALSGRAIALEVDELGAIQCPAILHWDANHFVVLARVVGREVCVIDPARGHQRVSAAALEAGFTGVALELTPTVNFKTRKPQRLLRFRDLLTRTHRVGSALSTLLLFGLVLQGLALLAPLYTQIMLDSAIGGQNRDLPLVLFMVFAALALLASIVDAARAVFALRFSAGLQTVWRGALFEHVLRLPLTFFEQRGVGDIQSRIRSMQTLETVTGQSATSAIVDGLMSMASLALLAFYSKEIAVGVGCSAVLMVLMKLVSLPARIQRSRDVLIAGAERDGLVLSAIRAVLSVKTIHAEQALTGRYRNLLADVVNRGLQLARLEIVIATLVRITTQLTRLAAICFAAYLVLGEALSAGALVAIIAYVAQFLDRFSTASDHILAFRLARADLTRVETLVAAKPEPAPMLMPAKATASLKLDVQDLGFRYSRAAPWLLRNVTFSVAAGEHVVITGPSGGGKSTLLKLLAGLYVPNEGRVACDGRWLTDGSIMELRDHCATVLQDDVLLAGTIGQNIAGFAVEVDRFRLQRAIRLAELECVIDALPLGLHTPVSDQGQSLSGGQRQRLLLARALYRQPAVLLLDEATSHLDAETERCVYGNLQGLDLTIIAAGHRSTSICSADRVLRLDAAGLASLARKAGDNIPARN